MHKKKKRSKFEELLNFLENESGSNNTVFVGNWNCRNSKKSLTPIGPLLIHVEHADQQHCRYRPKGVNAYRTSQSRIYSNSIGLEKKNIPSGQYTYSLFQRLRQIHGEDLQAQLDIFEDSMAEDHEMISGGGNRSRSESTSSINNYIVRVFISFSRNTLTATFQYDEATTAGDIVESLKLRYPAEDFTDYGLVFAFSVWMEEDKKLISDYGLVGEVGNRFHY